MIKIELYTNEDFVKDKIDEGYRYTLNLLSNTTDLKICLDVVLC